ncbi:hypothetical protein [Mycoplasmopsis cynos]|uniref:hypothetical protein n=1 Tax=Mycoplasmopsis cynos TaxID=171284 RepID=UPI002AFE5AA2|nr:hypothetical protein [Mycoplasmopsis cynos]WQQ14844.1 hypothetical protein RRG42_00675 [Mycoplasmopsis cynos]
MLSTLASYLSEELLEHLNQKQIKEQEWPIVDKKLIQNSIVEIVVQVNGKVRAVIEKDGNLSEEEIFSSLKLPNIQKFIDGHEIKRRQYDKDKIIIFK